MDITEGYYLIKDNYGHEQNAYFTQSRYSDSESGTFWVYTSLPLRNKYGTHDSGYAYGHNEIYNINISYKYMHIVNKAYFKKKWFFSKLNCGTYRIIKRID